MIKRLTRNDFEYIFPHMLTEFPASEMKSYDDFCTLFEKGKYLLLGYEEVGEIKGCALGYLASNGIFWLDYLFVYREYQNQGLGQKILKELIGGEYACNGVLLEVEPVEEGTPYFDNTKRRMRFYQRFNINPIDCNYQFPCSDGTMIHLVLSYLPVDNKEVLKREEIVTATREAVEVIHYKLNHRKDAVAVYIDEIKDTVINRYVLEDLSLPLKKEEIESLGRLFYLVDPYIYPDMFDGDINKCVKCAEGFLTKNTVYNYKNIKVMKLNGKIAGFMCIIKNINKDNHNDMIEVVKDSLGYIPEKFNAVLEGYFDLLEDSKEGMEILSLSVLPEFYRRKVASRMLESLPDKNIYHLACVKANYNARKLYEKSGFTLVKEYPGYTEVPCVILKRKLER